jgi:hypothetical protein
MALAAARWWLTGQIPHRRCTRTGTSQKGPALNETLKAAEFDDVKAALADAIVLVEQNGDLAVALNAGDGLDYYFSAAVVFRDHRRTPILVRFQSYLISS